MRSSKSGIIATLMCTFCLTLISQDAHYWSLQYGSKSLLMGGAVIGHVDDMSATFYNPGVLSLIQDPSFLFSADVIEFESLELQDGGGKGVDLGSTYTGFRPSLIAGTIHQNLFGKGAVLAYSVLSRRRGEFDFTGAVAKSGEDVPEGLDFSDVAGYVRYDGRYNDIWGGLTLSWPITSVLGLGATWYTNLHSQSTGIETVFQGVTNAGLGISRNNSKGGRFSAFGTLLKFGLAADLGAITAGLNLTTPRINIGGSGNFAYNSSYFSSDSLTLATNYQDALKTRYKSPLSIGAGLGWNINKLYLTCSAEWFDNIPEYDVMRGENFEAQQPAGEIVELRVIQSLGSVFNWAVGLEYALTSKVNGYASYYIDHSGRTEEITRSDLSIMSMDINNVHLGFDFVTGSVRATLGAGYGWGNRVDQNLTDIIIEDGEDLLATFVYRNFRILFGFEILFDQKDK